MTEHARDTAPDKGTTASPNGADDAGNPESARPFAPDLFAGQVAVVTGGGTGLGLQISRGLAALGADVVIASRSAEHHAAFLEEGRAHGWKVSAHTFDVREPEQVDALAKQVVEEHGRVDVLVNNAAGNFVCPTERMSNRAWRAVLGIVLDGTFYCSRAFGKAMIAGDGGVMLNIVATYAWTGMPGVAHSASAKAGVLALSKTLAAEWAKHNIRVNAIAPGIFDSDGARQNLFPDEVVAEGIRRAIPAQRFARIGEMASHCVYLLSPVSSYVTGECLVVDGGASLPRPFWEPGVRIERKRAQDSGKSS